MLKKWRIDNRSHHDTCWLLKTNLNIHGWKLILGWMLRFSAPSFFNRRGIQTSSSQLLWVEGHQLCSRTSYARLPACVTLHSRCPSSLWVSSAHTQPSYVWLCTADALRPYEHSRCPSSLWVASAHTQPSWVWLCTADASRPCELPPRPSELRGVDCPKSIWLAVRGHWHALTLSPPLSASILVTHTAKPIVTWHNRFPLSSIIIIILVKRPTGREWEEAGYKLDFRHLRNKSNTRLHCHGRDCAMEHTVKKTPRTKERLRTCL